MMRVGIKTVKDKHNLGTIDVTTVLAKSSNVGVAKIALAPGAHGTVRFTLQAEDLAFVGLDLAPRLEPGVDGRRVVLPAARLQESQDETLPRDTGLAS